MDDELYIPREELVELNKKINKVRAKAEKRLMQYTGVVAVGVGLKEIDGELKKELCFKVTVTQKKAIRSIRKADRIPEEIFGYKTDVVEVQISAPPSRDRKSYRPLIGGCQIQSSTGSGVGTLGCFAKRNDNDKVVLLTNWHVVVDNPTAIENERVGQPYHNGCCSCCATGEFAVVDNGLFGNVHDAATALLNGQDADTIPEERFVNEILEIGVIAGSEDPLGGETVFKYGRTTGLTRGIVTNDNTVIGVDFTKKYDQGVIHKPGVTIDGRPAGTKFIDFGDSGSVTVNELNQVVVLNWAIQGGGKITQVELDLGIKILDSSFPSTVNQSGVPLGGSSLSMRTVDNKSNLLELHNQLEDSIIGSRLIDLFNIHREEILFLVRKNKEVMVAWHRYEGPAYLSHLSISAKRAKTIPENINGISLQNLLLKMAAVLKRHGSPELHLAVNAHYLTVMEIFSNGSKPEDWKKNLENLDARLLDQTPTHA